MSAGKRYDTSEPLTEHDVAARLNRSAERVLRIMWDTRQLGLAKQVRDSRYLTHDVLGHLRAELDLWDVEPRPLAGQLDPLTPDAQAVADAYSRWLSSYQPTGAPMSEQSTSTAQQPSETVSTSVETTTDVETTTGTDAADGAAEQTGDDSAAGADAAADETSGSADEKHDGAEDGGSVE